MGTDVILSITIILILIIIIFAILLVSGSIRDIAQKVEENTPILANTASDIDQLIKDLEEFGGELGDYLQNYFSQICAPTVGDSGTCPDSSGVWTNCPPLCGFIISARQTCTTIPDNEFCKDLGLNTTT